MAVVAGFMQVYHQLAVMIGSGLLFFSFIDLKEIGDAHLFRGVLLALMMITVVYFMFFNRGSLGLNNREDVMVLSVLWIGVCLLFLLASVWNYLYMHHVLGGDYRGDIFRERLHTFFSPLYGAPETPRKPLAAFLASILIIAIIAVFAKAFSDSVLKRRYVLLVALLYVALVFVFGMTEATQRAWVNIYDYARLVGIADDGYFKSMMDVLVNWNSSMSILPGREGHYPPGNVLIAYMENGFLYDGFFKGLVISLCAATGGMTFLIARQLGENAHTAFLAMVLLFASAGALTFPTTAVSPLTMFLAAVAYWLVILAIQGRRYAAATCGFSLAIYGFFSFTVFIAGFFVFLIISISLANRQVTPKRGLRLLAEIGSTFLLFWLAFFLVTGFNYLECLRVAMTHSSEAMAVTQFDHPLRYMLRSTGNLISYVVFSGALLSVLSVFGLLAVVRHKGAGFSFVVGFFVSLLVGSFSTLFFLETERIWVFFNPGLAVAAAIGVRYLMSRYELEISVVTLFLVGVLLQSFVQELFLLHYL